MSLNHRTRIGRLTWDGCEECQHLNNDMSCSRFSDERIEVDNGIVYCMLFEGILEEK